MKKRVLSLMLVVLMLLGTVTGCGNNKKKTTVEGLPEGTVKLIVGIPQNSNVTDYEDNAFTKYIEKTANVELEFMFFSSSGSEYKQQLALMCSAKEVLPDVILGFAFDHYTVNQYGEDGYFIDLTNYIDAYAPNYKAQIEKLDQETKEYILEKGKNTENGAYYGMPRILCPAGDDLQSMMYINRNWLKKLGLKEPTTIEELKNVLTAFKNQDPNGNGKADEMPMVGGQDMINYLINAFVCYQQGTFNVTDGKVWDPIKTNEFRQALIYANELVGAGLYDELGFTMKQNDYKTLISPIDGPSKVGIFVGNFTRMTNAATNVAEEFQALHALGDATGKGGYTIVNEPAKQWTAYITKDCTYPAAAMKLIDTFYMDETVTRQRHGEKDVDWTYKEGKNVQGTTSYTNVINGQAFFSGNSTWCLNVCGIMTTFNYIRVLADDSGDPESNRLTKEVWDIRQGGKQPEETANNLVYTTEEYEVREEKAGTVSTYINEQIVLFVTGEKNPKNDATWNEFLAQLDEIGRTELMEICQQAYDRK